jgi:hypothetical protein
MGGTRGAKTGREKCGPKRSACAAGRAAACSSRRQLCTHRISAGAGALGVEKSAPARQAVHRAIQAGVGAAAAASCSCDSMQQLRHAAWANGGLGATQIAPLTVAGQKALRARRAAIEPRPAVPHAHPWWLVGERGRARATSRILRAAPREPHGGRFAPRRWHSPTHSLSTPPPPPSTPPSNCAVRRRAVCAAM